MALRTRPMQPEDVRLCADVIAQHPVIGQRYGGDICHLAPAWLRLLGSEGATAVIFEDAAPNSLRALPALGSRDEHVARIAGFGFAVFVDDPFVRKIKTPPLSWFGPELARGIAEGGSPVLSGREVRQANSTGGLNLICWEYVSLPEYEASTVMLHSMVSTFARSHLGYQMREMIAFQAESAQRLRFTMDTGGLFWDVATQTYVKDPPGSFEDLCRQPHIVGIAREFELERPGAFVGAVFHCGLPRLGFSPREQRLLIAALEGESGTDPELAAVLRVSVSVVKKMWLSIYQRACSLLPELVPASPSPYDTAREPEGERGKEKRRTLLAYLREHPEELRPYSRGLSSAQKAYKGLCKSA